MPLSIGIIVVGVFAWIVILAIGHVITSIKEALWAIGAFIFFLWVFGFVTSSQIWGWINWLISLIK